VEQLQTQLVWLSGCVGKRLRRAGSEAYNHSGALALGLQLSDHVPHLATERRQQESVHSLCGVGG
jgi:hypothetical protein